jgi:chromosome segregation ATPase
MSVQRFTHSLIALALLTSCAYAQEEATERAARLRTQLADVQAQQTDLQTRLAEIDEEIKPENIERSLAGVGSTKPEELREARRRQLDIQRRGIQAQLDSLAAARTRLESAIASADAERYRQIVGPNATSSSDSKVTTTRQSHRQKPRVKKRSQRKTSG